MNGIANSYVVFDSGQEGYTMRYIALLLCSIVPLFAQTVSKESVRSSNQYYWGEATADNEQEASDHALKNIVQSIAVGISSQMTRVVTEKNGTIQDSYANVIKSYSNATLRNVKSIKQRTENGIEVFSYIEKSEVVKMFEERKGLVRDLFENGQTYEEESNIASALKCYYFAIVLMNSIPDRLIEYQSKNLLTEIPARINNIIAQTRFMLIDDKMISPKERELHFAIETNGKPIRALDFLFWDGSSEVNVSAQDGVGIFQLYGSSVMFDRLDISLKYQYYESREEITEVAQLWNSVVRPQFKNSRSVSLAAVRESPAAPPVRAEQPSRPAASKYSVDLLDTNRCPVLSSVRSNVVTFLETLESMNPASARERYAADPFLADKIDNLVRYNRPVPVDRSITASVNKTATGWEVRKVRVLTKYPSLNRQATEYLILDFDEKGNLYDVNFGTVEQLYEHFARQATYGRDWSNRQTIVKFVEKYRTAFMTRNMPMLDSMFAEEAVIIVGREMKRGKSKDEYRFAKLNESQPDVEYTQYTKKQYLGNVKKMFAAQKDIFLGYSSFAINGKNDSPGTYGISMKQFFASTTYSDEGHLFLLVDFLQGQPQIYVRSWQPKEWNDDAIIKLSNFRLNK